jgi:hypothetical protein
VTSCDVITCASTATRICFPSNRYPLLSTSGGERTFGAHSEEDDESDDGGDSGGNMRRSVKSSSLHDNSIALWTLGGPMEDLGEASAAEIAME